MKIRLCLLIVFFITAVWGKSADSDKKLKRYLTSQPKVLNHKIFDYWKKETHRNKMIRKGKVYSMSEDDQIGVIGIVKAPLDYTKKLFRKYGEWNKYVSQIKEVEILKLKKGYGPLSSFIGNVHILRKKYKDKALKKVLQAYKANESFVMKVKVGISVLFYTTEFYMFVLCRENIDKDGRVRLIWEVIDHKYVKGVKDSSKYSNWLVGVSGGVNVNAMKELPDVDYKDKTVVSLWGTFKNKSLMSSVRKWLLRIGLKSAGFQMAGYIYMSYLEYQQKQSQ